MCVCVHDDDERLRTGLPIKHFKDSCKLQFLGEFGLYVEQWHRNTLESRIYVYFNCFRYLFNIWPPGLKSVLVL